MQAIEPTAVLHILGLFATADIQVWLDGGWGVDALLSRVRRTHNDLDLVLGLDDLTRAVQVLVRNGFAVTEEELGRVVLENAEYGRVDLHPVRWDAFGNGVQVQLPTPPSVTPLVYPREGFVSGTILGSSAPCISAEVQLAVRLGFDRSEKHRQDAVALAEAFDLPLPAEWDAV